MEEQDKSVWDEDTISQLKRDIGIDQETYRQMFENKLEVEEAESELGRNMFEAFKEEYNNEKIRIDNSGSIGIGTEVPGAMKVDEANGDVSVYDGSAWLSVTNPGRSAADGDSVVSIPASLGSHTHTISRGTINDSVSDITTAQYVVDPNALTIMDANGMSDSVAYSSEIDTLREEIAALKNEVAMLKNETQPAEEFDAGHFYAPYIPQMKITQEQKELLFDLETYEDTAGFTPGLSLTPKPNKPTLELVEVDKHEDAYKHAMSIL